MTKYVESQKNPLAAVKAYIALAGSIATGLLASGFLGMIDNDGTLVRILTGVAALATAVATYQFPNAEVAPIGGDPEVEYDDGFVPEEVDAPGTPLVPTSPEYEDTDEVLVAEEPDVWVAGEGDEDDFADDEPVAYEPGVTDPTETDPALGRLR